MYNVMGLTMWCRCVSEGSRDVFHTWRHAIIDCVWVGRAWIGGCKESGSVHSTSYSVEGMRLSL